MYKTNNPEKAALGVRVETLLNYEPGKAWQLSQLMDELGIHYGDILIRRILGDMQDQGIVELTPNVLYKLINKD